MNTQHTPGEWTLAKSADGAKDHVICSGPFIIARVVGMGYPTGKGWHPQSAANARLMAASPDLLKIAAELADWEADPDAYAGDLADLAQKARLAVAKATGVPVGQSNESTNLTAASPSAPLCA